MPNFKDYAREVLRDSFALWERGERVAAFAGVVLGSLLLWVFLTVGVAIKFKPEAAFWVSAALLCWLGFLVLVVSPYRIWKKHQIEIEDLKESLKPKLQFTFDASKGACAGSEYAKREGRSPILRWYRVGVKNISGNTIRNVTVELASFGNLDSTVLPQRLRPKDIKHNTFDLPPHKTEYIEVVHMKFGDALIRFTYFDDKIPNGMKEGKYKIKLKAFGDDTMPFNQFFFVDAENGRLFFGNSEADISEEKSRWRAADT